MPRHLSTFLLLASTVVSVAEPRPWKSADGIRTLQGEFVKRDEKSVTIKIQGGSETAIDFTKLHADEKAWVDKNHPLPGQEPAIEPPANAVFDTLTFDDTRETAMTKLKASKIVEMVPDEIFAGRSGLDALFRTKQKIGKLDAYLFFDWTEGEKLKEITIKTDTVTSDDYQSGLEPSWKEMVELITTLYGRPVTGSTLPPKATLKEGAFFPSHLWKLDVGGSILLGTARDRDKYHLVVRFTREKIEPVAVP